MGRRHIKGFTLLEVMVVLLIIGIIAGTVVINAFGADPQKALEKEARRIQVVVAMASDYAVLNQRQLGIRIEPEEGTYRFMWLDDEQQQWQYLDQLRQFSVHELPVEFSLDLMLEGLPWEQEEQLFDRELFDESLSVSEDSTEIGEDEEQIPPPQILLLSSGDVTPFSLALKYEPDFGDNDPVYFRVNAKDTVPLQIEGPLLQL